MADKDPMPAYETATGTIDSQTGKPTFFPAPPLTKTQMARKSGEPPASSPMGGGYYSNVAQKAKLILPTAIWILIVVGGICFLSLLATLNKTVNTLDTLVESEQAKADKLASLIVSESGHKHGQQRDETGDEGSNGNNNHHHHHHQQHSQRSQSHHRQHNKQHSSHEESIGGLGRGPFPFPGSLFDLIADDSGAGPQNWFTFPEWTSLEPRKSPLQRMAASSGPIVSEMSLTPVSGGIIIASSSSDEEPIPEEASGFIEPMLKQITKALGMVPEEEPAVIGQKPVAASAIEQQSVGVQPLITANIDKISININSESGEGKRKSNPQAADLQKMNQEQNREEEINSLEKSIDSLVSKLMDTTEASRQHENLHKNPYGEPRPPKRAGSPFSPLANLLMPLDAIIGESQPFMEPPVHGRPNPSHKLHSQRRPQMMGDPQGSETIVIAIGDNDDDDTSTVLPKVIPPPPARHRPSQSPYEFELTDILPMVHRPLGPARPDRSQSHRPLSSSSLPGSDPVMDALAEEMAESLFNQMMMPQSHGPMQDPLREPIQPHGKHQMAPEPIVLVQELGPDSPLRGPINPPKVADLFPMPMMPKKPKMDELKTRTPPEGKIGDVFEMMFGPAPESKLVMAPPLLGRFDMGEIRPFEKQPVVAHSALIESSDASKATADSKEAAQPTTASPSTSSTEMPGSAAIEGKKDAASDALEAIIEPIFASPQMSNNKEPVPVETMAQRSGSSDQKVLVSSGPKEQVLTTTGPTTETYQNLDWQPEMTSTTPLPRAAVVDSTTTSPLISAAQTPQISLGMKSDEVPVKEVTGEQPKDSEVVVVESLEPFLAGIRTTTTLAPTDSTTSRPVTEAPTAAPTTESPRIEAASTTTTTNAPTTTTPLPTTMQPVPTTVAIKDFTSQNSLLNSTLNPENKQGIDQPLRQFFKKADDFIERNILNFRRFLA